MGNSLKVLNILCRVDVVVVVVVTPFCNVGAEGRVGVGVGWWGVGAWGRGFGVGWG